MNTIKLPAELIEAISILEPSMRCEIYDATIQYVTSGEIPSDLSATANAIITLAKPLIDKANRKQKTKMKKQNNNFEKCMNHYIDHSYSMGIDNFMEQSGFGYCDKKELYKSATKSGILDQFHEKLPDNWQSELSMKLKQFIIRCKRFNLPLTYFNDHPDKRISDFE